jgi:hypothetical protein
MDFIGLILLVALYFLPWIVAYQRDHYQCNSIALLNLFLGWTFIGWVAALVWSVSALRSEVAPSTEVAPSAAPGNRLKLLLVVALLVAVVVIPSAIALRKYGHGTAAAPRASSWLPKQSEMSFENRWQNSALSSAFVPIARTLAKHKRADCGSFSWSESLDFDDIYLVACRGSNDSSSYSIVRTDNERIYTVGLRWLLERPSCQSTVVGRPCPDPPVIREQPATATTTAAR